ncbi:MAG: transposase [Actinomycetota bacterium]|nr:transposase [Actinomycetota bacterium]
MLARKLFHGQPGELPQHYREGQEDQPEALGPILNAVVLWNTGKQMAPGSSSDSRGSPCSTTMSLGSRQWRSARRTSPAGTPSSFVNVRPLCARAAGR